MIDSGGVREQPAQVPDGLRSWRLLRYLFGPGLNNARGAGTSVPAQRL